MELPTLYCRRYPYSLGTVVLPPREVSHRQREDNTPAARLKKTIALANDRRAVAGTANGAECSERRKCTIRLKATRCT
jgi:hypothetical protein